MRLAHHNHLGKNRIDVLVVLDDVVITRPYDRYEPKEKNYIGIITIIMLMLTILQILLYSESGLRGLFVRRVEWQ